MKSIDKKIDREDIWKDPGPLDLEHGEGDFDSPEITNFPIIKTELRFDGLFFEIDRQEDR